MPPKKPPPPADPVGASVNSAFIAEFQTIYDKVMAHEKFKDLQDAETLGFESVGARHGGTVGMQSDFDLQEFQVAMQAHGVYRCAMNELYLDKFFAVQSGIPYNRTKIFELAETSFSSPGQWNGTNVVLVSDLKKFNPKSSKGSLRRLSPEEPNFARIIGIHSAILAGADDSVLDGFKVDLLCAPFQFEYYEGGAQNPLHGALPRAINLRESVLSEAVAVGRDTVQRIFEVIKTRSSLEQSSGGKVSNEALVTYYKERITLSAQSEPVTKTFIELVSLVHTYMLKSSPSLQLLCTP